MTSDPRTRPNETIGGALGLIFSYTIVLLVSI